MESVHITFVKYDLGVLHSHHISSCRFHNHFIPSKDYRKYFHSCDAVILHSGRG